MKKILEYFRSEEDFEIQVSKAIHNANTTEDYEMCRTTCDRYIRLGIDIFITDECYETVTKLQLPFNERKTIGESNEK